MDIQFILIIGVLVVVTFILVKKSKNSSTSASSKQDIKEAISLEFTEQGIQNALANGNKVEAIKIYRIVHSVGLREAKEAVDEMYNAL